MQEMQTVDDHPANFALVMRMHEMLDFHHPQQILAT